MFSLLYVSNKRSSLPNLMSIYLLVLQTSYYVLPDRYILNIRETIFSFLRCFCGKIHSARNDLQLTAGYLIYWKIKNNISSNVIPQRCRVIVAKYSYRDIEFKKRYNSCQAPHFTNNDYSLLYTIFKCHFMLYIHSKLHSLENLCYRSSWHCLFTLKISSNALGCNSLEIRKQRLAQ